MATYLPRGYFVTFEGGEGGGKTTQSSLLMATLKEKGIPALHTREPGGTPGAEAIRTLLVEGSKDKWDAGTELLLHLAARRDHIKNIILPSLAKGMWVISDRFNDSTIAYQGYGHQLGEKYISLLSSLAIGLIEPHVTFLLDITTEQGLSRAMQRRAHETRYEQMDIAFHERVRQGFLTIAKRAPHRFTVLDATRPVAQVHASIMERITPHFLRYRSSGQ